MGWGGLPDYGGEGRLSYIMISSLKGEYQTLYKTKAAYAKPSLNDTDCNYILGLVTGTKSKTILDFGGGRGHQYSIYKKHNRMGIREENITIYDIGLEGKDIMPKEMFDGVISTDVMEHIPEEEIDEVLDLIFSKARRFVYIGVFCGPALKLLPNGDNAHCTIKPPEWWRKRIKSRNRRNIPLIIIYRLPKKNDG